MSTTTYSNILIPGRHHVVTNFQHQYLHNLLTSSTPKALDDKPVSFSQRPKFVWAVTSANHSNTRRNPIAGNRREVAIEHFGTDLPAESFVYLINDLGATPRFADYLIKDIEVQSRGLINITPENTLVACSTPAVIEMYEELGYRILPLELTDRKTGTWGYTRAWQVVEAIAEAGPSWRRDSTYLNEAHEASKHLFEKYGLGDDIVEIHSDPILGDEGDITDTRDYSTYVRAFDFGADRKYRYIQGLVRPGRIVDIGCATGAIIKEMGNDDELRESDLYGIEVTRKMYEICQQRKAAGEFNNENVFFYQRNILSGKVFPDNSINTTTAFSLTHEIESYVGREALKRMISQVYRQTAVGGVFINVDVVGPAHGDQLVLMKLNQSDGVADDAGKSFSHDEQAAYTNYLNTLSTYGRFLRFARDFRAEEKEPMKYQETQVDGEGYIELKLSDAAEFLSKKDYTDNWFSEMHERFCFWSFQDWKNALEEVGFTISPESHQFTNPWLIENRYKGKVDLFKEVGGRLESVEYPPSSMILIGEKRV